MKKIGILTLNGNMNYGNRLQNYALEQTILKLDAEVDTIWLCSKKDFLKQYLKRIVFKFPKYKRNNNFFIFSKNNINIKYYLNYNFSKKYDYFIVGSDQVWNPNFPDFSEDMFLKFSNKERNISYAASFGVNNIKNEYIDMFRKGINNVSYLSVREERGKSLIKELTNREDVDVLIDPTMLLKCEEWDKISKKPNMIKQKKYILNYFLGDLSEKRKIEIDRIARKYDCDVINILDRKDAFYECGPSEFLYLEKNAFLICTDSFHSSVFAILYNTPFLVFDREDKEEKMNSRIETLLSKFKLEDRKFKGKITEGLLKCNYTEAKKILEKEREKSMDFLKKSLDIEE